MTDDDWSPTVPIADRSEDRSSAPFDGEAPTGNEDSTEGQASEGGEAQSEEQASEGDEAPTEGQASVGGQARSEGESAEATGDEGPGSRTDGDEVEPVEVLVQLAEDGEIDPWDIDIVAVTDAFLAELDETDLRTSGRALFYASVLLRMKADAMVGNDEPDEEEPEAWDEFRAGGEVAGSEDPEFDPVDALEAEMDRRLERRSARGTPETLDELVRELRDAERDSWWKRSREYDTTPGAETTGRQTVAYRGTDDMRGAADSDAGAATANTHEEDIETLIEQVHSRLSRQYDKGRTEVLFRELRGVGPSAVRTYLAVLFLSHRGHVRLQQDDLFGDLWLRDPTAPSVSDEAVAD